MPMKHPASAIVSRTVCQAMGGCKRPNSSSMPCCTARPFSPRDARVPTAHRTHPFRLRDFIIKSFGLAMKASEPYRGFIEQRFLDV